MAAAPSSSSASAAASAPDGFPRDYGGSLAALNSTQLQGAALRRHYNSRTACLEAMRIYLARIGLTEETLAKVPTLHVTGSKGKGSTCAFVEAMLRAKGLKTVLFSSPHLVKPNERIRLDGKPLPDDLWAKHFWAVWDRLHQSMPPQHQQQADDAGPDPLPGYFRLLTLLCLWVAVEEQADALILEVGVGGRYDATNVVPAPVACAVTRLDLEHTDTLGDTIAKIAWEKGGIVKPGARVCVVGEQAPALEGEALPVLEECARAAQVPLQRIAPLPASIPLGMVGDFQRGNAAVAVAVAQQLLRAREGKGTGGPGQSPAGVVEGDPVIKQALAECSWPGRCQRVEWGGCRLLIDGAHTEQSMRAAVAWYDGQVQQSGGRRCLIFHCGEEKAVGELLRHLIKAPGQPPRFGVVVFCPVASARPTLATVRPARALLLGVDGGGDGDERLKVLCDALEEEQQDEMEGAQQQPWQNALRGAWRVLTAALLAEEEEAEEEQANGVTKALDPAAAKAWLARADAWTRTVVRPSVAAALEEVKGLAAEGSDGLQPEVLVTGSLYLVGNTLEVSDRCDE